MPADGRTPRDAFSQSLNEKMKPRLPQLRPNVNRRAQQIIAAHMRSASDASVAFSSTATVPILTKIESTAPKTARTHDISHLADKPKFLAPNMPPSLIKEEDHVYESSFMPKDATSIYSDQDGLWHTKVFPSNQPSSRTDAVMLDAWITRSLEKYQKEISTSHREDFTRTVEDLVPILSVAVHEVGRQVTHHCSERGRALDKIWRTYVELFNRVLLQMQETAQMQKQKTAEVQNRLNNTNGEYKALRKSHPDRVHKIISDLEMKYSARQKTYEDELTQAEEENVELKQMLRDHHRELEIWFPGFTQYQDTYIKNLLPQYASSGKRVVNLRQARLSTVKTSEDVMPEVSIAEDFKRLLAVLAPEKRKILGQELAGLVETSNTPKQPVARQDSEDEEDKLQQLEVLQAEVREQEERIRELKSLIAQHEVKLSHQTNDIEEKEDSHSSAEDEASNKDEDS
jgi:hypothetical protein